METYLGKGGTNDVLLDMQEAFGSKLYTPADHQAFWQANGRWPSADELTVDGPRVVVISNNTGSGADVAFGSGYMGQHFDHTWEDRSGIGMMGSEMRLALIRKILMIIQLPLSSRGYIRWIPFPLFSRWTRYKDLPRLSRSSFHKIWRLTLKGKHNSKHSKRR